MKKGRIRKANRYIKRISENEGFYLAHKLDSGIVKTKIEGMDLNEDYKIPTPPKMSYKYLIENIRGKQRIDKTQREKFEQTINWRITDWHGKEHTGISSYTRERYKRVYSNPKEVKLAIVKIDEEEYVITELLKFSEDNNEYNCLVLNIFYEVFGDYIVLDTKKEFMLPKVSRINWEIIKPGTKDEVIRRIISLNPKRTRSRSKEYFDALDKDNPELFVGTQGFNGYIVFKYESNPYVVVESLNPDNATYIFEVDKWEEYTKLSKQELIDKGKHIERITHFKASWIEKINKYLPFVIELDEIK